MFEKIDKKDIYRGRIEEGMELHEVNGECRIVKVKKCRGAGYERWEYYEWDDEKDDWVDGDNTLCGIDFLGWYMEV